MRQLRTGSPELSPDERFAVRLDRAGGGMLAQIWFLTSGCTWDMSGSCTMCNYGHGQKVTADFMVESVELALASIIEPVDELLVSPSGSMLDSVEVPQDARQRIFERMASFGTRGVCVETRAETVTAESVEDLANAFTANEVVAVELGLESSSTWIQQYCINKMSEPGAFTRAVELLKRRGIRVYANVSLGSAFLTAAEAIKDSQHTVEWALNQGVDLVLVFPMHIKSRTLLAWLYERGLYQPPSLWALVEVFNGLDPAVLSRVSTSWYRSNYGAGTGLIISPTTCPRCRGRVLGQLDRFRDHHSLATLGDLNSIDCDCREEWRREMQPPAFGTLPERVVRHYEALAKQFGLTAIWKAHGDNISDAIHAEAQSHT